MSKTKIQNPKSKTRNRAVSPARIAAFEILSKIETEKAFSSILLPIYEDKLSPQDRALCHELTLGVLRRRIYLDRIIEKLTNKKIEKLDAAVVSALRIGLYQLLFLEKIPAYSAINESVNLVQMAKKTSAKGLVNAVLRRATREEIEFEFTDEFEKLSVETSHPRWLIEKWIKQFGFDEAKNLAKANNEIAPPDFRFTLKTSEGVKNALKREDALKDRNFLRELAEEGKIYFQDKASQLVAQSVKLKKGEKFLDVCAAPGGKTTFVAYDAGTRGHGDAGIIAGDFYFQRVKFLRKNCRTQGGDFIEIVQYNAENSLPFADESFDTVLVDAPCSGTGTIRRNPEIRYFLQKDDFRVLSEKQLRILKNASKTVKAGGRLIYSTCSLEAEENEAVVDKFLSENSAFEKVSPKVPDKFLTEEKFARTFPPRDEMDGFFIAAFEKKR